MEQASRQGAPRGLILAACCASTFMPGAFIFGYAGVMAGHWQEAFGADQAQVGQSLFYFLATLGLAMFFSGRWLGRLGPRRALGLGALFCGLSAGLAGAAQGIGTVYLWAFVLGLSASFTYLPALAVAQVYFPRRLGLVTGLVNLVFGISGAVAAPLFSLGLATIGYQATAWSGAAAALVLGLGAAALVSWPTAAPAASRGGRTEAEDSPASLNVSQALRTAAFWFLWLTWALGGAAGIAMVTLATSFGQSQGLPLSQAVMILTAFNLTSGLSRLISGYLSDLMSRNRLMALSFAAAGAAYLLLPHSTGLVLWCILAGVVGYALGTLFAVSSPLAVDCFGLVHFGPILGLIFTAYGFLSGALGPWLAGFILDRTGDDYTWVFSYLGVFFLISAGLILGVRRRG